MKRNEVDRERLSPGMKQYMEIKDNYPDELLFYRLGDFYELFFEDGILCSRELELTLTSKNAGLDERIPMCGVPFHAVKPYIEKLISKGYKVAICEQLEDPKSAKGVVKRGVINVYSKGSIVDNSMLKEYENNYIGSVIDYGINYILTFGDISTGEFFITEINHNLIKLQEEILKQGIKEIVVSDKDLFDKLTDFHNKYGIELTLSYEYLNSGYEYLINPLEKESFKTSVKHLWYYLTVRELNDLSHVKEIKILNNNEFLQMDIHTIRNLELVNTIRLNERTYSLIWLLDKTKTAMGSRKLKNWLLAPLVDKESIEKRYDAIDTINSNFITREELRTYLDEVYDLERLCSKVNTGIVNARDLLQILNSLKYFPKINESINKFGFTDILKELTELKDLLENSLVENPPIGIKEGGLIKEGYNKELDELKEIRSGGKNFIASLEEKIKEETGIKNVKVGYTKVFGYYIEVSKGQAKQVKDEFGWERRQTLTNCERFISPELKEKESLILNAEEKIYELEYNLFNEIKESVKKCIFDLNSNADIIASLDALVSLAIIAEENSYVRPTLNEEGIVEIKEGRHPVVERVSKEVYVKNDCIIKDGIKTLLITGPNMSGKSTYMRELAIIVIMAQIGSFVPASSANLPIIDKIFTRIGASDDLVGGESTFMVEMKEAERALSNATSKSLVLFDELGRGTSTYDGMSLAGAILKYITDIGCITLFSTHYHELTTLAEDDARIKNIHIEAKEENDNVIFLHKVVDGAVDKSYGIHVAKLANMPNKVLNEAKELLKIYETKSNNTSVVNQISFDFNPKEEDDPNKEIITELKEINVNNITPLQALEYLNEIKNKLK